MVSVFGQCGRGLGLREGVSHSTGVSIIACGHTRVGVTAQRARCNARRRALTVQRRADDERRAGDVGRIVGSRVCLSCLYATKTACGSERPRTLEGGSGREREAAAGGDGVAAVRWTKTMREIYSGIEISHRNTNSEDTLPAVGRNNNRKTSDRDASARDATAKRGNREYAEYKNRMMGRRRVTREERTRDLQRDTPSRGVLELEIPFERNTDGVRECDFVTG